MGKKKKGRKAFVAGDPSSFGIIEKKIKKKPKKKKKTELNDLSKVEWQPCKNPFCAVGTPIPKPMDLCGSACSRQFNNDMLTCERYKLECPFLLQWGSNRCMGTEKQCKEWREKGIIVNITLV